VSNDIVNKKVKLKQERIAKRFSLRRFPNFSERQNTLPMKRIKTLLAIVVILGAVMTACSSQKQSCAAYSEIEYQNPADNG
jgi:hypothetical protein